MDTNLVLRTHVQRTVSGCFAIRSVDCVRSATPYRRQRSCHWCMDALVINSDRTIRKQRPMVGLLTHLVHRLQSVPDTAARLICELRRFDHVTCRRTHAIYRPGGWSRRRRHRGGGGSEIDTPTFIPINGNLSPHFNNHSLR